MSKRLEVMVPLDRPRIRMLAWLLVSHGANAGAELAVASWLLGLVPESMQRMFAAELAAAKAESAKQMAKP